MKLKGFFISTGAILAGIVVSISLSVGTDYLLQILGVLPDKIQPLYDFRILFFSVTYRSIYTIAAGFIVSALSQEHAKRNVIILGCIGVAANAAGGYFMRDYGPLWYPIALTALCFPCVWLGGKLNE